MAITAVHGILLENFLVKINQGEKKFIEQVIYPAFLKTHKEHGYRPMIVPIIGIEEDGIVGRQYYDEEVIKTFDI